MTNTAFVELKPINELEHVADPLDGKVLLSVDGNMKTTDLSKIKSMLSAGIKGVLKISDPKPAVDAVGKYDLSDVGTYNNLIPIIAVGETNPSNTPITTESNFINSVYWDGTNFIQLKKALPQASNNIRRWEDLQPSDFPLVGYQQVEHNDSFFKLPDGVTAQSTDVPGVSDKWIAIERNISDLKIFAGTDIAKYLKTDQYASENAIKNKLLLDTGYLFDSTSYYTTPLIRIEDNAVDYITQLSTTLTGVAIFDKNKIFKQFKSVTQLADSSLSKVARNLSDDFSFDIGDYFQFTSYRYDSVSITFDSDIIIDHTVSELEKSTKPINSYALEPS